MRKPRYENVRGFRIFFRNLLETTTL